MRDILYETDCSLLQPVVTQLSAKCLAIERSQAVQLEVQRAYDVGVIYRGVTFSFLILLHRVSIQGASNVTGLRGVGALSHRQSACES